MPGTPITSVLPNSDTQQLWQEFSSPLRAFIRRRVGSEADAEDILQDVFLRVHQHVGGLHHTDRLTSWLYQVTRNAIIDHYRSPVRREQLETVAGAAALDLMELPEEESDLDADHIREELATCLRPMIGRLPPHYREAVAMVDLTGLTQVQAAERLGLSVSGMKSRVQRGRRVLKDLLVDCCPVQLDPGGRIVDYEGPNPTCTTCAGSGRPVALSEDQGHRQGRCCAPPGSQASEQPLEVPIRWLGDGLRGAE
jgi:RNA polymerase sigma-70 factor (ECF subfamily)